LGVAALPPLGLFLFWGALSPPGFSGTLGLFFTVEKLVLASTYLAMATLLMHGTFTLPRNLRTWAGASMAAVAVTWFARDALVVPALSRLTLETDLTPVVAIPVLNFPFVALAILWWNSVIAQTHSSPPHCWRFAPLFSLLAIACAASALSPFFASRYLVPALPFLGILPLMGSGWPQRLSPWRYFTRSLGVALGLYSLHGYYLAHPAVAGK
jgi:hypothetical protein